ncbi:hypothetical protein [Phenylobacterium aquaticum]|uniref:hypothetical protein n=1 Tax=Phenylobacterium aquaticum TaxID=1763816 RepID=UPI0026EAFAC9|nr:hypothetical protein [Phenylobacterium aquaticum]
MKLGTWMGAAAGMLLSAAAVAPAWADAMRSEFCTATRAVPRLDQDNYVSGALGPVYVTQNFETDLPQDELVARWRGFIAARHPPGYQGNPDDDCHVANTRRDVLNDLHGDKQLTVDWSPTKGAPR